ncbi:MAG: hypothetical protein WBB23_00465, partial [Desulforhopalus sp.]
PCLISTRPFRFRCRGGFQTRPSQVRSLSNIWENSTDMAEKNVVIFGEHIDNNSVSCQLDENHLESGFAKGPV